MNTSYNFNSTPQTIDRNKYIESLMDFSTPMSTISNQWMTTKPSHEWNNSTILDQLLQKFHEHQNNFQQTQNHLHLLDNHLHQITAVLNQLQHSLDRHSSLKPTTDHFETRLLQMSIKREQIRTVMNNCSQSPAINQTLDDIIHQISPLKPKCTDPVVSYAELINAIQLSFNQKSNLIEHFHHEESQLKDRLNDYHGKIQQRQQLLLQLVEQILEQQKTNEKYIHFRNLHSSQSDHHTKQCNEFTRLQEKYQLLQEENRQLKNQAKENIKRLYHFINQTME